jgi:hypothetical protein|tara:strand:- start:550 stop:1395 length:846 start_codon:yes stop_codon:yes gene_type:complete
MSDYDFNALCLGAGVQSTAMLLMAEEGLLGTKPDVAIFADTQWEPKEVYDHLESLKEAVSIPIIKVTEGNLRQDVLDHVGSDKKSNKGVPPLFVKQADAERAANNMAADEGGMLWRQCTAEYKIKPLQKELRRLLGYKPRQRIKKKARIWLGISIDEAHRQKDSRVSWIDHYYPLINQMISRDDCINWFKKAEIQVPRKSACLGCPYHSNSVWHDMRKNHPAEWDDVVEFDHHLRKGKLPGVHGDVYVHKAMLPIDSALDQVYDPDQLDLFGEECEGLCGV